MKSTITISAREVSIINDLLGSYRSEKRIKQINGSTHGITVSGAFDSEHNYTLSAEVPESMVLGLAEIAMSHAKAIRGLIQAINGIKDTIEYLSRNISRDIRSLMKEYEKK